MSDFGNVASFFDLNISVNKIKNMVENKGQRIRAEEHRTAQDESASAAQSGEGYAPDGHYV